MEAHVKPTFDRQLLDAARREMSPNAMERARVHGRVLAAIAGVGAAGTAGTAAAASGPMSDKIRQTQKRAAGNFCIASTNRGTPSLPTSDIACSAGITSSVDFADSKIFNNIGTVVSSGSFICRTAFTASRRTCGSSLVTCSATFGNEPCAFSPIRPSACST